MKRKISLFIAALLAALPLATVSGMSVPTHRLLPVGENEVSIIAWAGYIERGDTDPAYDWVTGFEADTGCKVVVKTAATSDEMVSLMNEGNYDLVIAPGDVSLGLIASGRIGEIDISRIPGWHTVDERLQNAPWHTVDGKHYGVPFQWGPNVLMYNTEVFAHPPTSWNVVFEKMLLRDGKSNEGRIEAFSAPISIADAALYLMYHNPDLGITDPYSLDGNQFTAVLDLLSQQNDLVFRYWQDAFVQIEDFINEGVVASSSWLFQANLLAAQGSPIASVIPEEGTTGWADTTMMNRRAEHPNCAYMWLEHSINPKVQGDVAAWFVSVPAVPSACSGNELLGEEGCTRNGFDDFEKIYFWRTPTALCGDGRGEVCIPYYKWVTSYIAVISGQDYFGYWWYN